MLQTRWLKTLDDVRGFLAGNQAVAIQTPNREAACAFIAQSLSSLGCRLGKADKGLVRAYLAKVTGLSRALLARLGTRHQGGERLTDRRGAPARPFARRYTH